MMKNARIRIALALLLFCSLRVIAQEASGSKSVMANSPISISFETGRYDPDPNCKKEIDGCFPRIWSPEREFKAGSKVWVKITVVNHSDQVAVNHFPREFPPFNVDVVENVSGTAPKRTKWGCWMNPSSCPLTTEILPSVHVHGTFWEIAPGQSKSSIIEVTREYEITSPGEYSVSVETDGFELTATENSIHGVFRDKGSVKHLEAFKADEVRFQILN